MRIHLTTKQWTRSKVRLRRCVIIGKGRKKSVRAKKRIKGT